jgi:hypothetical protein
MARPTDALARFEQTYAAIAEKQRETYVAMAAAQQGAYAELAQIPPSTAAALAAANGAPALQAGVPAHASAPAAWAAPAPLALIPPSLPKTAAKAKLPNILGPTIRTIWTFISILISIGLFGVAGWLAFTRGNNPAIATSDATTATIALLFGAALLVLMFSYFALMGYGDVEIAIGSDASSDEAAG